MTDLLESVFIYFTQNKNYFPYFHQSFCNLESLFQLLQLAQFFDTFPFKFYLRSGNRMLLERNPYVGLSYAN